MQQIRPKNLNLFTIQFPIPAIVSILHRIAGVVLFLLIPAILWLFNYSLSEVGYQHLKTMAGSIAFKLILLGLLAPLIFHIVAGIRHLLSDIHIGDSLVSGRISAWLTFIMTFILLALAGIWIW